MTRVFSNSVKWAGLYILLLVPIVASANLQTDKMCREKSEDADAIFYRHGLSFASTYDSFLDENIAGGKAADWSATKVIQDIMKIADKAPAAAIQMQIQVFSERLIVVDAMTRADAQVMNEQKLTDGKLKTLLQNEQALRASRYALLKKLQLVLSRGFKAALDKSAPSAEEISALDVDLKKSKKDYDAEFAKYYAFRRTFSPTEIDALDTDKTIAKISDEMSLEACGIVLEEIQKLPSLTPPEPEAAPAQGPQITK